VKGGAGLHGRAARPRPTPVHGNPAARLKRRGVALKGEDILIIGGTGTLGSRLVRVKLAEPVTLPRRRRQLLAHSCTTLG